MNRILWTLVVLASLQRIDNTSGAVPPVQGGLKRDRKFGGMVASPLQERQEVLGTVYAYTVDNM